MDQGARSTPEADEMKQLSWLRHDAVETRKSSSRGHARPAVRERRIREPFMIVLLVVAVVFRTRSQVPGDPRAAIRPMSGGRDGDHWDAQTGQFRPGR